MSEHQWNDEQLKRKWHTVTLLTLGFGLVGLDRWLIAPLFPAMTQDLGLDYQGVLGFTAGAAFLYASTQTGAHPTLLFALLFASTFFCFGLLGLITGPIATDAAPAGLVSSTVGIVIGTGEIFGGGIAPAVAGAIAKHFGIQHTLTMALVGLIGGSILGLFLRETAPRRLEATCIS